jgi:Tfp pilus assembly protein PilO
MMRRRSRIRLRLAAFGVVLLAANGVAFAAFTWPQLNRVRRAEDRAQEVAARRATLEKVWERVTARRELLAQNRRDLESLSRDYLKSRDEDLFPAQREIENMARAAGLSPKKSTYEMEAIKGTDLVRCEVTLPLDGSYQSLTGFLSRIERASRFIVVDQMALVRDEQGARMNLKVSAIFKEEDSRGSR